MLECCWYVVLISARYVTFVAHLQIFEVPLQLHVRNPTHTRTPSPLPTAIVLVCCTDCAAAAASSSSERKLYAFGLSCLLQLLLLALQGRQFLIEQLPSGVREAKLQIVWCVGVKIRPVVDGVAAD